MGLIAPVTDSNARFSAFFGIHLMPEQYLFMVPFTASWMARLHSEIRQRDYEPYRDETKNMRDLAHALPPTTAN